MAVARLPARHDRVREFSLLVSLLYLYQWFCYCTCISGFATVPVSVVFALFLATGTHPPSIVIVFWPRVPTLLGHISVGSCYVTWV